jgi:hypothetical protein
MMDLWRKQMQGSTISESGIGGFIRDGIHGEEESR